MNAFVVPHWSFIDRKSFYQVIEATPSDDIIFAHTFDDSPSTPRWINKYKMLRQKDLSDDQYEELNRKLGLQNGDVIFIGFRPPELTVLSSIEVSDHIGWINTSGQNASKYNTAS